MRLLSEWKILPVAFRAIFFGLLIFMPRTALLYTPFLLLRWPAPWHADFVPSAPQRGQSLLTPASKDPKPAQGLEPQEGGCCRASEPNRSVKKPLEAVHRDSVAA